MNIEVLNPSVSYQSAARRNFSAADKSRKTEPLILVLGKDADALLLYRSFLEMWNYRVVDAGCIEKMLKTIEYLQPQIILMDGNSLFENNLEAIQKIRGNAFLHNIPILLVSGYSQPKLRALALKAGADDFLVKPLNFDELRISLQVYTETYAPNERQGRSL